MSPAQWPDTLAAQWPNSFAPGFQVHPASDGIFVDLTPGAPGVTLQRIDPPSPHWFDQVSIGAGSSCVYATDVALGQLTHLAKITSTSGTPTDLVWSSSYYPPLTNDHGRFYLYLDENPIANLRPIHFVNGDCYLRVRSSDRKLEILKGNTAQTLIGGGTASQTALVPGSTGGTPNIYRFEWNVVYGAAGVVTFDLYLGHSTTKLETFAANVVMGANATTIEHGNTNGASLGGKFFRMGGFAGGCRAQPGPLNADPSAQTVFAPDGTKLLEVLPNGELIIYATEDRQIASGGTAHYMIQRGDPIARFGPSWITFGPSIALGNPVSRADASTQNMLFDLISDRATFESANLTRNNDPVDLVYARFNVPQDPTYTGFWKSGTGCTLSAGNPVATFSDLTLTMKDRGHGINIAGTDYNIAEILGPTSCTLKPTPSSGGSGLLWKLKGYPQTDLLSGIGAGGDVGQNKFSPGCFPFVRKSNLGVCTITIASPAVITAPGHGLAANDPVQLTTTGALPTGLTAGTTYYVKVPATQVNDTIKVSATPGGADINTSGSQSGVHTLHRARITTNGTASATAEGFTSADIGRHLLINDDPLLPSSKGSFIINNVVGSTITLDQGCPTRTQVDWRLAGNDFDQAVEPTQTLHNQVFKTNAHTCNFGDALQVSSGDYNFNFIQEDVLFDNSGGLMPLITSLSVKSNGGIEVLPALGTGLVNAKQFQLNGQALHAQGTHAARLASSHVVGQLWSETDTGLIYRDNGVTYDIYKADGHVRKTADEIVNNSAVLQNDDHLFFPVEPNEVWFVEALLFLTSPSANSDFQFGWSSPAGMTANWSQGPVTNSAWSAQATTSASSPMRAINNNIGHGTPAGGVVGLPISGVFVNGGTAGTLNLQWSQFAATVEDSKVLANSLLRIRRLA